uniref:Subtilisin-like protease fibronectin type-III domain-containing protein n=1 Tax=Leersia perrieri TaxID=77586 RepID=A0A0D9VEK7_9ORYZ
MDSRSTFSASLLLVLVLVLPFFANASSRLYIVYMGEKKHDDPSAITASHHDILTSVIGSKDRAMKSIVYSYKHGFSGFAAMLTESQAEELAKLPEVVSVKPNTYHTAHTTRSWDFLGVNYYEQSGIWPESRSFDDHGYGPVPARWKGKCQTGVAFNATACNRKLIGVRWYSSDIPDKTLKGEYLSARDLSGHGTHIASTIVGGQVWNVSHKQGGLAAGVARGGAPRARVAVYKVCWGPGISCGGAGILAAIDDAINDGVDVISMSIGPGEYDGTLHAVARGIPVVLSGGNDGPTPQTVGNTLPWVITVADSTVDRTFPTFVSLGNDEKLVGQSLYYNATASSCSKFRELVDGSSCNAEALSSINVTGKFVLCSPSSQVPPRLLLGSIIRSVTEAGATGLIFVQYSVSNTLDTLDACNGSMPCVLVDNEMARIIDFYISSTTKPVVKVSPAMNVVGSGVLSPRVGAFSSRGPSTLFPGVLKPDIAAPGVSILAAVGDSYQFMSGTSMACPHVSAVVALLKMVHPDWSPAMIKSAIVTTASVTDRFGMPIQADGLPRKVADPFDFGGGHIQPDRAIDPGLVYDINPIEYTKFFNCTLGPKDQCESYMGQLYQLNLPSIAVPDLKDTVTVSRTVTNVGVEDATYNVVVDAPAGVSVSVEPSVITFTRRGSKSATFKVTFTARQRVQGGYTFGSLTWLDGSAHSVRIPVAVRTIIQDFVADTSAREAGRGQRAEREARTGGGPCVWRWKAAARAEREGALALCSALLLVLVQLLPFSANASTTKLYIVYMGEKKHDDPSVVTASHHDTLTSVLGRYLLREWLLI